MDLQTAGSYIRSRVALIMGSPLITVGGDQRHEGRPARLASIESAMNALVSLASIVESKAANHDEDAAEEYDEDDFEDYFEDDFEDDEDAADAAVEQQALLPRLMEDWRDYMTDYHAIRADDEHDSEHEDEHEGDFALSMEALYVLLMEGNTDRVVDAIASVLGRGSADQGVRIIVEGS